MSNTLSFYTEFKQIGKENLSLMKTEEFSGLMKQKVMMGI